MTATDHLVRVRSPLGRESHGRLADIRVARDHSLLEVEFEDECAPGLPIGGEVEIALSEASTGKLVWLIGKLVTQNRVDGRHRCHFELATEAKDGIRSMVNRRQAVRVQPGSESPITVSLHPPTGGDPATPSVHDISTAGIAVIVSREDDAKLFAHRGLSVIIRLSEHPEPLELEGSVRVRRLLHSSVLYGIQFEAAKTSDFADKQALIRRYVMERQMTMLRSLKPPP